MRLPLLATAIVAAAVVAMVGLGIWQLNRAEWKKGLVARYETAAKLPPVAWPSVPPADDALLFRRASGFCNEVTGWRSVAGRNSEDQPGWTHIASCRTGGLEGPGMQVEIGWSKSSDAPKSWRGGEVSGTIISDREHKIRLVADRPAPGLKQSAIPSPRDLPDNHFLYALQWFFFAAAAAVIYVIALRQRQGRNRPDAPDSAG